MKEDKFSSCVGIIASLVVVLVVGTLIDGWALSKIWNWFMPPIFHLVSLTLWQAIGVSMVFEIFTRTNKKASNKSDSSSKTVGELVLSRLIEVTVVPLLSVGIAWIVLQFAF